MKKEEIQEKIFNEISYLVENKSIAIDDNSSLIGDSRLLSSMSLIELCFCLEDFAKELGFEFNWKSEQAFSQKGIFRSAGALVEYFIEQRNLSLDNSNRG